MVVLSNVTWTCSTDLDLLSADVLYENRLVVNNTVQGTEHSRVGTLDFGLDRVWESLGCVEVVYELHV